MSMSHKRLVVYHTHTQATHMDAMVRSTSIRLLATSFTSKTSDSPSTYACMQSAYHIHTYGTRLEITSPYTAQRARSLCTFSFRENHNNTPLRITFFPLNPRNPQSRYVRISLCGGIVCAAKTSRNTSRMCSLCVHSSLHTINAQPNQFIQPCSHRKCSILHLYNHQLDCTKITGSLRRADWSSWPGF